MARFILVRQDGDGYCSTVNAPNQVFTSLESVKGAADTEVTADPSVVVMVAKVAKVFRAEVVLREVDEA